MIDVISLSIAIGAVIIGMLGNIRKSKCLGVEIETRTPLKGSVPDSPIINHDESTVLLKSDPIDITNKRKPFIKNWL